MNKPLVERIPFAKIAIVLACVFGVSFGLCGATAVFGIALSSSQSPFGLIIEIAAPVELIAMALSAVGLVITLFAWALLSIFGNGSRRSSDPPKFFDNQDTTEPPDQK